MLTDFRLEVFREVARTLNFSKAAKRLHISQPAVSGHISELENTVGDLLFTRLRNGVALTPKGEILLEYCRRILFLYECADRELVPRNILPLHSLRIAAHPLAVQFILPEIVQRFKRLFPSVELSLTRMDREEALQAIEEGDLDLAIAETPAEGFEEKLFVSLAVGQTGRTIKNLYFLYSKENRNIEIIQNFILTSIETS